MTLFSTALTSEHDLSQFDCGKSVVNDWLRTKALAADKGMTSRTYVWVVDDDPAVKGYYSIAPTVIDRASDGISNSLAAGLRAVPGFLLAKCALDKTLQGQGYGADLLHDAITKMMGAALVSGGRLIVVDAIDDAAAGFYRKHGFIPVSNSPDRLVIKMSTALKAFGIG